MIKAVHLIFSPFHAWTSVITSQRSVPFILCCFLLPLMAFSIGLETLSLLRWGEQRGEFGHLVQISQPIAIRYAAAHATFFLFCVFLGAFTVQAVVQSFNVPTTFLQAFTTVAYGISPIVLMRMLDAVPFLPTWVCWGIGAILATSVLYHGVGLALKPDQTKGFGLFLVTVMIVLLSTAVSHLLAQAILHEKILR